MLEDFYFGAGLECAPGSVQPVVYIKDGERTMGDLSDFLATAMSTWTPISPPTEMAIAAIEGAGEGTRLKWQPVRIGGKTKAAGKAIS